MKNHKIIKRTESDYCPILDSLVEMCLVALIRYFYDDADVICKTLRRLSDLAAQCCPARKQNRQSASGGLLPPGVGRDWADSASSVARTCDRMFCANLFRSRPLAIAPAKQLARSCALWFGDDWVYLYLAVRARIKVGRATNHLDLTPLAACRSFRWIVEFPFGMCNARRELHMDRNRSFQVYREANA